MRLLTSSIGQKLLMAATGLLLIGFLVAHLSGNLLIFVGPTAFNEYSHALVSNHLIYLAEVALLVLFVLHFVAGIAVAAISADSEAQQTAFAADQELPFLLLSDERRSALEARLRTRLWNDRPREPRELPARAWAVAGIVARGAAAR